MRNYCTAVFVNRVNKMYYIYFKIECILDHCVITHKTGTQPNVFYYDASVETVPDTTNMRRVYIICNITS
jgi:hypothetical protein